MAKSVAADVRNEQAEVYASRLVDGYVRVYAGTPPANVDASLGAAVLLAECRFGSPAFGAASGGVVTATAIAPDASANANGTASFYRTFEDDGTSPVEQGTVGTSGADMIVPTTSVVAGIEFSISSFTHSVP
jgi:hypothetical protein